MTFHSTITTSRNTITVIITISHSTIIIMISPNIMAADSRPDIIRLATMGRRLHIILPATDSRLDIVSPIGGDPGPGGGTG